MNLSLSQRDSTVRWFLLYMQTVSMFSRGVVLLHPAWQYRPCNHQRALPHSIHGSVQNIICPSRLAMKLGQMHLFLGKAISLILFAIRPIISHCESHRIVALNPQLVGETQHSHHFPTLGTTGFLSNLRQSKFARLGFLSQVFGITKLGPDPSHLTNWLHGTFTVNQQTMFLLTTKIAWSVLCIHDSVTCHTD